MTTRRKFITTTIGLSIYSLLVPKLYSRQKTRNTLPEKLYPKALKKGATVGLIAPGYIFSEEILSTATNELQSMGYQVYHTEKISSRHGYFSNTDAERAADLNHMFGNKNVDGILCIRGGYGCTRLMPLVDYDLISRNPKPLIGFSDVTALLNGIHKMTGLVTFHGPVGSTLADAYSKKALINVVRKAKKNYVLRNAPLGDELKLNPEFERYTIYPGNAEGVLCGGSLTLVNALIGTPSEIDFTNKLVCLEDVGEAPYRIDRMLTQLIEGKTFRKAAGIIIGVCKDCNSSTDSNSFTLKEVILDRIKPLGIPAAYGFSFGHVAQNFTFPIGTEAFFDANDLLLKLTEKPVS